MQAAQGGRCILCQSACLTSVIHWKDWHLSLSPTNWNPKLFCSLQVEIQQEPTDEFLAW